MSGELTTSSLNKGENIISYIQEIRSRQALKAPALSLFRLPGIKQSASDFPGKGHTLKKTGINYIANKL